MHPSLVVPTLLLSLPILTFASPTPQDGGGVATGGEATAAGNTQTGNSTFGGTATNSTGNDAFFDPNYDPAVSQDEAESQIEEGYREWEAAVEQAATMSYTSTPLSPSESAAIEEYNRYWSTVEYSSYPIPTGTDYYDLGIDATGTYSYELPKVTDPCGPDVQDGTQFNTCTRDPDGTINDAGSPFVHQSYDNEPSFYGASCLPMPAAAGAIANAPTRTTIPLNASACHFTEFCASIDPSDPNSNPPTDQWIWNSWSEGCALAIWLPSDPAAADWPDPSRCEFGIFRTMATYCEHGQEEGEKNEISAVNVKQLQGGGGTGMQVNAGYPSYIVSPEVLSALGPG